MLYTPLKFGSSIPLVAPWGRMTRRPQNICRKLAAPVSEGPRARIFGTLESVSIEHATLANSAMVRYLDMSNAYLMTSTAHPSNNFPGILALGEAYGVSGKDVLLATLNLL